jgi:16S rRNA (guanine(966)-N(2))-methyltransferase RsmD
LRITGGEKKGIPIKVPKKGTRPPTGMIRSAVFNILGEKVSNSNILDLFAGSGSFSIEALSRGAKSTVMVESLREAIDCIKENLIRTGFSEKSEVLMMNFFKALKILKKRDEAYDIAFVDPPFEFPLRKLTIGFPVISDLMKEDGILVLRLKKGIKFGEIPRFEILSKKTYGDSEIYFLRKR